MVEKPTEPTSHSLAEPADKAESTPVVRSHAQQQETSNTSYSSYLFGRAGESDKPLWSDSTRGRAMIRLVSRGIVGAVAMTAVDRISRNQLQNYSPDKIKGWMGEDGWWSANLSQKIAKGYDVVFGVPIQKMVSMVAPAEKALEYGRHATSFRYKSYYHDAAGHMPGHSLGAEIVQVTASFAAGSLGDAGTRNIIQSLDPNNLKSWRVNDKGEVAKPGEKAHTDYGKWLGSTLRTSWRVISKNMGEDWAVALPYVYQMRWQRSLLGGDRFPNVKLCLDNSLNGGSTLIDRQGNIRGDFQLAGAVDLHARFVGYNWYTLMYRETYDAVGRQLHKWKENGFTLSMHLPSNPIAAAVDTVGYGARYVAKSFIKANLYMNPAVIPFWMMRVPQSKWRSPAIIDGQHESLNAFAMAGKNSNKQLGIDDFGHERHMYDTMGTRLRQTENAQTMYIDGVGAIRNPELLKGDGPYSFKMAKTLIKENVPKGLFSAALMPFGWLSYKAGGIATAAAELLPQASSLNKALCTSGNSVSVRNREMFMRNLVDNSLSYTPYMIAKAETALRVDERPADGSLGAMDKAIYKFIDSGVRFDFKHAGEALRDIGKNATDMGREVKMREGGEISPSAVRAPTPLTPEDKPNRFVDAHTIKRDPSLRERASDKNANDNEHSANDNAPADKNWAESVTGKSLDGRFQSNTHSIH